MSEVSCFHFAVHALLLVLFSIDFKVKDEGQLHDGHERGHQNLESPCHRAIDNHSYVNWKTEHLRGRQVADMKKCDETDEGSVALRRHLLLHTENVYKHTKVMRHISPQPTTSNR